MIKCTNINLITSSNRLTRNNCKLSCYNPEEIAISTINKAVEEISSGRASKINAIWLENSGCFSEVISLLNAEKPDIIYFLSNLVNLTFFGSIEGDEGETAFERILDTLNKDYIFIVSGAAPTKSDGLYTTIATYNGRKVTAIEAIKEISKNAKHIISVGTCASFGGITAGNPNISQSISIQELLPEKKIIKIPGCPANPAWIMGTLGYLVAYGVPDLDSLGRPTAYYSESIHDRCPRRRFFDIGVFAKKFGDEECMFMLGCKGPVTYAYCPVSRWNNTDNWPIGDNTTCIGCAGPGFPDKYEPFVEYGGYSI